MTIRSLSSSTRNLSQAAFAACLLMASVALPSQVRAADTDSRLRQLEGSVDTLNRAVFKGETPPTPLSTPSAPSSDYQASVETRLNDLEAQLRDLIGRVEKQEYDTTQLKSTTDKALADMNLRLEDMQKGTNGAMRQTGTLGTNDMGGAVTTPVPMNEANTPPDGLPSVPNAAPAPAAAVQTTTDPAPANPNDPASQDSSTVQNLGTVSAAGAADAHAASQQRADAATTQYETAFSMLKSGNYANAKSGFENFMKTNPDHPLAANATYWLGESYYASGDYEKAARIFAESYKKYPKGPKVADSLLKMGMSLASSGKKKEGCVALKQLKKEFSSGGNTVTIRRADQEITRLNCGA